MRIQLSQTEIESALRDYISNQGFNLSNKQVTVNFTNTRNPSSTLADIDIEEAGAQVPVPRMNSILRAAEAESNNPGLTGPDVDEPAVAEEDLTEKKSLFG